MRNGTPRSSLLRPYSKRGFGGAIVLALGLVATAGCDDGKEDAPAAATGAAAQPQSVAEGAEAKTAAGKQVERAKERIEVAEDKLQQRDDAIVEQTVEVGTVERGLP